MNHSYSEFRQRYAALSDDTLLDLWQQNTLTEQAQMALRAELQERGLPIPEIEAPVAIEIPEPIINNGKWITITEFSQTHRAHVLRALLETEGIPVFLADEHLSSMHWFLIPALGGVRVQVPEAYVQQSLDILEKLENGELHVDWDADDPEQQ